MGEERPGVDHRLSELRAGVHFGGRSKLPFAALAGVALLTWICATTVYLLANGGADATPAQGAYHDVHARFLVTRDGETLGVDVQFLIAAGDGDVDASARAAIDDFLARVPGAVEAPAPEVTAEFVSSGYWWASHSASWSYNSAGKPAGLTGELPAIAAAASTWTNAGAQFSFSGGATSTLGTGACAGGQLDGSNVIGWGAQSGAVLAVTCTWYNPATSPAAALEFDMQIDPEWSWTTGSAINVDVQSVVLHELGHALGLSHSDNSAAVMFASYCSGCNHRTLHADDIAGLTSLYGGGGAASPTPTRTPTATPTAAATATATATPTRTPTATPTATATATPTRTPTAAPTATATPTRTPTAAPTATPTRTPTVAPTATPTSTQAGAATATPTRTPTATSTATATSSPAASATATATLRPGSQPAPGATPRPNLALLPGINLLTWPNADASPASVLGPNSGIAAVYSYNAATGRWERYFPGLPPFVNTLTTLQRGRAYWFIAQTTTAIVVE